MMAAIPCRRRGHCPCINSPHLPDPITLPAAVQQLVTAYVQSHAHIYSGGANEGGGGGGAEGRGEVIGQAEQGVGVFALLEN